MGKRPLKERFEEKVFYGSPDGCHYWTGAVSPHKPGHANTRGYGQIRDANSIKTPAHRVSYELYKGKITNGLWVLHSCDNRLCVNPDHLFLGTVVDNVADMISKGRHVFGESVPQSKLTEDDVMDILVSDLRNKDLAKIYNVDAGNISAIRRGVSWSHVNRELYRNLRLMFREQKIRSSSPQGTPTRLSP